MQALGEWENQMSSVSMTVEDRLATITIDRPPVNAMDRPMYKDIIATIEKINGMVDEVGACVLRTVGKVFIAGNDVGDVQRFVNDPEYVVESAALAADAMGAIYTCRVPVVAAVQGAAVGAGAAVAGSCDLIVASEKVVFGIPEITLGIVGAGDFLRMLVPEKVARYAAWTGKPIPATEVRQYGGVHKIVPPGEEYAEAVKVAQEFLKVPPRALEYFKQAMNETADRRLKENYRHEIGYTEKLVLTGDFKEAVSAFLEKRPPVYTGR